MVQSEDVRADFVVRLKKALSHAGIPEWGAGARLAEIAGRTAKAASKWLNGETMPGRANMIAIASALKVRTEWLQYSDGDMLESRAGASSGPNSTARAASNAGSSTAQPLVVQIIAKGLSDGVLTPADGEQLRDLALYLVKKNLLKSREPAALPANLNGLAEAALRTAENGENPDDLLKMLEKGLSKQQPKEEPSAHEARKKRTR